MFLRRMPRPPVAAVLSIHGRREFPVEAPDVSRRLDLSFDDVAVPVPGDDLGLLRAAARRRWAEQNGLVEAPPTPAAAAAIIDFARSIQSTDGMLLCHCGAGMSRAPAAALICLATWRGPGSEPQCVADILSLRRGAVPHPGLVRFADDLLGRNGRLIAAFSGTMHVG